MVQPRSRDFAQVDVFAAEPYRGNPVAVVLDGAGIPDEAMAQFAAWTNLSETTFVLPPTTPEADYRLRIFTPGAEIPFAGHPTLGSAHAWLEAGGVPKTPGLLVQECGAGLVELRHTDESAAFRAPELVRRGDLKAIKIGGRGQWRVEASELEAYVQRAYAEADRFVRDHPFVEGGPSSRE